MKKLFLVAALLVASISFAKPVETKQEEVTLAKVTEIKNDNNVVVLSEEAQEFYKLCFETITHWYQGTFYDPMSGSYYESYTEIRTINCY